MFVEDHKLYYAVGSNRSWDPPQAFEYDLSSEFVMKPAMAELDGTLHAVVVEVDAGGERDLVHYQFDDGLGRWAQRCGVAQHTAITPALGAFHGQLFCVWATDDEYQEVRYAVWTPDGGWTPAHFTSERTWGSPALFVVDDELHLLFAQHEDTNRQILECRHVNGSWERITGMPAERAKYGVSAVASIAGAWCGFLSNDEFGSVLVCHQHGGGSWDPSEPVYASTSSETPALVELNGVLTCCYTAKQNDRLQWAQRPVALHPTADWMSYLRDGTRLCAISIPGSHDSPAVSWFPFVACQSTSISDQLNAGIRFLDLRAKLIDGVLRMYHGPYPLGLTLESVLGELYTFLDAHRHEVILASMKDEGSSGAAFASAVSELIADNPQWWYAATDSPTLLYARGKIVLLKRYGGAADRGLDVSAGWVDNSPQFCITTPGSRGVTLNIQDFYSLEISPFADYEDRVNAKMTAVVAQLSAADLGNRSEWYLNFTSGKSTQVPVGLVSPFDLACGDTEGDLLADWWRFIPGVNARLRAALSRPANCLGVLIMDFPECENDLVGVIIESNWRP